MELVRRIKTPEEAALAIEAAQKFALARARREQLSAFSPELSSWLLRVGCPSAEFLGCLCRRAINPAVSYV